MLVAATPVTLSACGDDSSDTASTEQSGDTAPGAESAAAALEQKATVIDVRTPEEYAAGHIDDAQLINVEGPTFDDEIGALDTAATYVVYCRSGNRSATAAKRMRDAGLTVLDGGGMDVMIAAGWPTA